MALARRRLRFKMRTILVAGVLVAIQTNSRTFAAQTAPLFVDASAPFVPARETIFKERAGTAPSGATIGVNSRYLSMNGQPWLPVMGEFQFSRYPAPQWEQEILKMKSAGVQIIATYIFWNHHEEIQGQFDWTGDRDLRRFVRLCAKHKMLVYLRIGPWAHGESRNGGFPDWLLKDGKLRSPDPNYMKHVEPYFNQIGQQVSGLMWKDGGPIIGVQIENEYSNKNEAEGEEYLQALKKLAIEDGMEVPLYSVTGWGRAVVPAHDFIPVWGGYPDAPWDRRLTDLPPNDVYRFVVDGHHTSDMGMINAAKVESQPNLTPSGAPFMTVEMGGGLQDTYHRRPMLNADDIAAMMPVALGSGVNVYGTYIFQGGENPDGRLTTLQESRATGSSTDVPVKSYDFQAPLSEFGEERESLRKFKLFNYFLNDFGSDLAPMVAHTPSGGPRSASDLSPLRFAVRNKNDHGYVFVNNYVRGVAMPDHRGVQFALKVPGQTMLVPEKPVDVPSGAYFIWPFNLDLDGVTLRYSTAQPLARLGDSGAPLYFFFCLPGVRCDFVFGQQPDLRVEAAHGHAESRDGNIYLGDLSPGATIMLKRTGRQDVDIVVLSQQEAEQAWKVDLDGKQKMLFTAEQFYASKEKLVFESSGDPNFKFSVLPGIETGLKASFPLSVNKLEGERTEFTAHEPVRHVDFSYRMETSADAAAPAPPIGKGTGGALPTLMAPTDDGFAHAAKWSLALQPEAIAGLSDIILQIKYEGDVARLTSQSRLLTDNFYNGSDWRIGMKRFFDRRETSGLELFILPLKTASPIFFEDVVKARLSQEPTAGRLERILAIPVYELDVDTGHDRIGSDRRNGGVSP